jgi:carbon monoxide dehydrogenase subunit G
MMIEGAHTFSAPREEVWKLLLDPEVIGKTMPGATGMKLVGDGRYEGKVKVGIGAMTAAEFDVLITLVDMFTPERYTMQIDGRGTLGFTRGTALVELLPATPGPGTLLHYKAEMQVGGKVAAVGQRLLDSIGKMMARQGLEALSAELERRLAGGGG